ncbi:MAG: 4-hydroxy-tetrahydrodipicolinate synthase [Hyphomonadaceae bacterium]|nr:4-hydroxy-tetrahydrodipicolinate synthase [Hyphomonadaceae bacterium]
MIPEAFQGSIPALLTPFRDGVVDGDAFQSMIERQIVEGSHGLVPCGTTGESATLSNEEHARVVALCVETAAGRTPVIAGAGSNNTAHAIELARTARAARADAILVVAPYYNKPSQEGLVAHFKAINDAVDIPMIVYNVPARTITDIAVETLERISALRNVVGIKDATGDMSRVARQERACGDGFVQLSGDDGSALSFNAAGGRGCISVTANVAPALCAQLQLATKRGDFETARAIDAQLSPLHKALFVEPSPAPAKYACSLLGLCREDVRLPLLACSDAAKHAVRQAMIHAGLL